MNTTTVYDIQGSNNGTVELNPALFGVKINDALLELVVRLYANNKRTGNAHTKTRAEVRGGGTRPWRQKGTGRARTSSNRNSIWRGGGTIFGPRKRTIYTAIPKDMAKKALLSALTKKLKDENIYVVDALVSTDGKTKTFSTLCKSLGVTKASVLFVVADEAETTARALRNLSRTSVKRAQDVNAYHILRNKAVVLDKKSLEIIEKRVNG